MTRMDGARCAPLLILLAALACSPPASQQTSLSLDGSEPSQPPPSNASAPRLNSGNMDAPLLESEESSAQMIQLNKDRIDTDPDYALAAKWSMLRSSYQTSPAKDTPEAQQLVALARSWGYGIEVIPHLYSAAWDYHYFLQNEPNGVAGKTFRSRWESLMEFEYGITPEMMAIAYQVVPTVHWGAIDNRVPATRSAR